MELNTVDSSALPQRLPSSPLLEKSPTTTPNSPNNTCYNCKQEGHWYRNCPLRTPNKQHTRTLDVGSDVSDLPVVFCRCAFGPCVVRTSGTEKNPGRKFYACPCPNKPGTERCGFFKWCDEVLSDLYRAPTVFHDDPPNPPCPCGAGWCLRRTVQAGEHVGRKFFACPAKNDKCDFIQWCDMKSNITKNPMCSCGAGRSQLVVGDKEHAGRPYFACAIKKGQGACDFFRWYDSVSLGMDYGMDGNHLEEPQHPTDPFTPNGPSVIATAVGERANVEGTVSPGLERTPPVSSWLRKHD